MVATPPKYNQSKYLRFLEDKGKERVSILEPLGALIAVISNLLTPSDADIIDCVLCTCNGQLYLYYVYSDDVILSDIH